ncbi:MAG: hypothetical protein AB7P22_05380, partial [Vicinamibacterales bacterium]
EPQGDRPELLRLFLTDGTAIVSYGEPARVGERVVFSIPTSASPDDPQLHLVDIAAARIDWQRTNRYADAVRAASYIANHGESAYELLTAEIADVLNSVAVTSDPSRRLALVEQARRRLAEWPGRHYNYKATEIAQMLEILDGAIADLRAAVGVTRFDLSFVAPEAPSPEPEPLMPPPSPREAIEQTLVVARLTDSAAARKSLLTVALARIDRDADVLPSDWRTYTRTAIQTVLAAERRVDRSYLALTTRTLAIADSRTRNADVRGLERLLADVHRQDERLGHERPDAITNLVATLGSRLDAARRLSLARERWALRLPELRKVEPILAGQADRLNHLKPALEDIRALAVSAPSGLSLVEQTASGVLAIVEALDPPEELRVAHALLQSAAQLATSAARIRREAALAGDLSRAWDASSAAAGAMMMFDRARTELRVALSLPQLVQ